MPIPILPSAVTKNALTVPVATCKSSFVVEVPIPSPLSVLFQYSFESAVNPPEPFENCIAPIVPEAVLVDTFCHDKPFGAVDDAVRTCPLEPTDRDVQPLAEEVPTIRLPVVVARALI